MQLDIFGKSGFKDGGDKDSQTVWHVYTDGASRNNPGPSGAGIYIEKNGKSFLKKAFFLGTKTNNEAEYFALLLALILLQDLYSDGDKLEIFADSKLIISQVDGSFKLKAEHLKKFRSAIISVLYDFDYNLTHILREKNTVADKLSNDAIDKKIKITPELLSKLAAYEIYP